MTARWEYRWPMWQPLPESGHPAERGGCTADAAYDAGLILDPPGWTQPVPGIIDPRRDPESDEYDSRYDAECAREEPEPESLRRMQAHEGWTYRRQDAAKEPPEWELEAG